MLSLKVAILLALSTQFDSNAVHGYMVAYATAESGDSLQSTTPRLEDTNSPVIEAATLPTFDSSAQSSASSSGSSATSSSSSSSSQVSIVQRNINNSGSSRKSGSSDNWLCREGTPENGFFIKHFRQYNYYYPNGKKLTLPIPCPDAEPVVAENLPPIDKTPVTSTTPKPTIRYNKPGIMSGVPNNGFNYVYLGRLTSTTSPRPIPNQTTNRIDESSSSEESEERTTKPTKVDQPTTPAPRDNENNEIREDTIAYTSEPNRFANTRTTVVKTGKKGDVQSQKISVSSTMQSNSWPCLDAEQPDKMSNMQSLGQSMNWITDPNIQNRIIGYNPFFQPILAPPQPPLPPQLPLPQLPQLPLPLPQLPLPQLPLPRIQKTVDWLAGSSATSQIYPPIPFQYLNTWPNFSPPFFDIPNMSASYSTVV